MAYSDLQNFLARLEEAGELHRVRAEVDPELEIAAIVDRVGRMPEGGPALVFEKVKGSIFPVAANLFGSYRRMCLALECSTLNDLSRRVDAFLAGLPAGLDGEWWRHLPCPPARASIVPMREIIDYSPDLESFPFLRTWPGDSGRAATLPLVFSEDPETGQTNCGMYRVRILGPDRAAIHWRPDSGGGRHWSKWRETGRRMPVAIAVGGDPSLVFASMLPLPEPVDELHFAGFLRNAPVGVVRCLTSRLMVPANAEMVIEGYLEPGEVIGESLFGNHTGFYARTAEAPVFRVTCITRKKQPVLAATVVGRPPMEDCWLAKAAERLTIPFIRRELPEVVDINRPMEWIFHNCAVVSINKTGPGHAGRLMQTLRSGPWLSGARFLLVVDADIDVQDLSLVAWRMINVVDWKQDVLTCGTDAGVGSSARMLPGSGTFVGIDATRKWPEERSGREWPAEIGMTEEILRLVDSRWHEYGL